MIYESFHILHDITKDINASQRSGGLKLFALGQNIIVRRSHDFMT